MKTFFKLFLFLPSFLGFRASAQSKIDVKHYNFSIGLNDNNDTVSGSATILFSVVQKKGLAAGDTISFDLAGRDKNGKGMVVRSVMLQIPPYTVYKKTAFTQADDKVRIIIPKKNASGAELSVVIRYEGIPGDGLIIAKNKYGDRTFFADNWPNRAHNWIPCKDDPSDKASFEFMVKAPAHYQVISNGKLIFEKEDHGMKLTGWAEDVPLSTKVMVIGVAKFAVTNYEDSPAGIPTSAWVYPQDSMQGSKNYHPAVGILKFFSDYVGAYPYNKLANVQSKTIFGGMENASAIFYEERSASAKMSVEDLLAHEIAHQWFGDMATEKSFPHLWLSEGFATYFCDLYYEYKYGFDSMNTRLKMERRTVAGFVKRSDRPVVDSVSPLMDLLNANSYQKGAWVLHMLRMEIGDSSFHLFSRTYYNRYKGKNATTEDLIAVAEETSGRDLKWFFDEWLYKPGIPQLQVKWRYDETKKAVLVTVIQIQKQQPFRFPLQIELLGNARQVSGLSITEKEQDFVIPVQEPIRIVNLDPNTKLLFEGKAEKE
jgi:aminopeptidase N